MQDGISEGASSFGNDQPGRAPVRGNEPADERELEQAVSDARPRDPVAPAKSRMREPVGLAGRVVFVVACAWSLFQLWHGSRLPLMVDFAVLNDIEARSVHLAFATFLAYTVFPAWWRAPRERVPELDWALGLLGAFGAGYLYLFYEALAQRAGAPGAVDLLVAVAGLMFLLEATRRALGILPAVVASVFLVYSFGGLSRPEVAVREGASLSEVVWHQWLSAEGAFGIALGASTDFVFPFVLFGALLHKAGAVQYLVNVAFSLLGYLRGGAVTTAAVSSVMTGVISGSSTANVSSTGTITTALMKRADLPGERAGAVEVAAATNGQLVPPIMGVAAFLMVDQLGISTIELIKHAFLPALISLVALIYLVHLEGRKADMKALPDKAGSTAFRAILYVTVPILCLILLTGLVYYGLGWLKDTYGTDAKVYLPVLLAVVYLALLGYASRGPQSAMVGPDTTNHELPDPEPTVRSGLHHLLPFVVLVWCLAVERLSPVPAVFWASVSVIVVLFTQRPLLAVMRRTGDFPAAALGGIADLFDGLAAGARLMVAIAVASAAVGIVLGAVALTDAGGLITGAVQLITGGNFMLTLVATALISLVLGAGLPTAAGYIVLSTVMVPVIVAPGAQAGHAVPLIAAHLFVFYFGVLAGGALSAGRVALAAAAVARSDPLKTGLCGAAFAAGTAVLPFVFIFNTQLLMVGHGDWVIVILTVAGALCAALAFAAAVQGFFLVKNRFWETALLLLVAFTLVRPGFWWDMIYPPSRMLVTTHVAELAERMPPGSHLRLRAEGTANDGQQVSKVVTLPLGPAGSGPQRLAKAGIEIRVDDGTVLVDNLVFGSPADRAGLDFEWRITGVEAASERPPKQLMFLPVIILYGLVTFAQRRRRGRGRPPDPRAPPRLARIVGS